MILFSSFCFPVAPLTLKDIQNELREVTAAKWYQLGVQLGISPATLSTIASDYPLDAQRCMTEVILWWLQNAPECSWAKLAQAVEAMGGYAALAERLRQKHPKVRTSMFICYTLHVVTRGICMTIASMVF